MILRDFTGRNDMMYKLPPNEFVMDGCYLQLEGMFPELPRLEGIVMASMFMLPESPDRRQALYDAVFAAGAGLAFALEDTKVLSVEETEPVEALLSAYHLLGECPEDVELDPLPVKADPVPGWSAPAGEDWNPRG